MNAEREAAHADSSRRFRSVVGLVFGGLLRVVVVVWGAATAGFIALRLIPGDPVDVMLGVQARVSDAVRDQIRADWGLDQPPLVQYLSYLGRVVQGDLGISYQLRLRWWT
jgi:peptide/nickel transport system permease protein